MMVSVEFVKVLKKSRFLDPSPEVGEVVRLSEVRHDPLTGHSVRVLDFPVRPLPRADLTGLVEASRQFCPFCPEVVELVTPRFHPELAGRERYARGEALCVPNAFPYDENGAVTVMTHTHYVPLDGFTPGILTDATGCCLQYLADISKKQPDMVFQSVNWNYMPQAGGSIIHPHLQVVASSSPTNYYSAVIPALERYRARHGTDYWSDLVDEERRLGERIIGDTGRVSWMMAFAPMGIFDVLGVLQGVGSPVDIDEEMLRDMSSGIVRVLRYIDSLNMHSLNMSLYFYMGGSRFTPHLRICPRANLPPFDTSQVNYMGMLHKESLTIMRPEEICVSIRALWGASQGE
jgi:galactose-1-phosphate uridylyltransferase